jgi:hypothetical protein
VFSSHYPFHHLPGDRSNFYLLPDRQMFGVAADIPPSLISNVIASTSSPCSRRIST